MITFLSKTSVQMFCRIEAADSPRDSFCPHLSSRCPYVYPEFTANACANEVSACKQNTDRSRLSRTISVVSRIQKETTVSRKALFYFQFYKTQNGVLTLHSGLFVFNPQVFDK